MRCNHRKNLDRSRFVLLNKLFEIFNLCFSLLLNRQNLERQEHMNGFEFLQDFCTNSSLQAKIATIKFLIISHVL